jgi:hypothetical protein
MGMSAPFAKCVAGTFISQTVTPLATPKPKRRYEIAFAASANAPTEIVVSSRWLARLAIWQLDLHYNRQRMIG